MDDEKRWQDMNADEQAKRITELAGDCDYSAPAQYWRMVTRTRYRKGKSTLKMSIYPMLVAAAMLLSAGCASAESALPDFCLEPDRGQQPNPIPQPTTLKEGIEKKGKERIDELVTYAMQLLSSCPIDTVAPYRWTKERLAAMVAMDAALPLTLERTEVSADCESILNYRQCSLELSYRIENATDNRTFRSVVVACAGVLKYGNRLYYLGSTPVQYDPIAGYPLGPLESRRFQMVFGLGNLAKAYNYNREQLAKYGGTEWCHVLAAR